MLVRVLERAFREPRLNVLLHFRPVLPAPGRFLSLLARTVEYAMPEPMSVTQRLFSNSMTTPRRRQALVDACKKYLTGHPGEASFAAGTLAEAPDLP